MANVNLNTSKMNAIDLSKTGIAGDVKEDLTSATKDVSGLKKVTLGLGEKEKTYGEVFGAVEDPTNTTVKQVLAPIGKSITDVGLDKDMSVQSFMASPAYAQVEKA